MNKLSLKFFAAAITFAVIGFVSCTEGGSLEVKNDHTTASAIVNVWFEDGKIETKDIEAGKTGTWIFGKDGSVYYSYHFADDYNYDGSQGLPSYRVLVMGGDVTKVTIKP